MNYSNNLQNKISQNFAIINNVIKNKEKFAICFFNKTFLNVLNVLYQEGLINNWYLLKNQTNTKKYIIITLKYINNSFPLFKQIQSAHKPGHPRYISWRKLCRSFVKSSNFCWIISTNLGLMSVKDAIIKKKGGLLFCKINLI